MKVSAPLAVPQPVPLIGSLYERPISGRSKSTGLPLAVFHERPQLGSDHAESGSIPIPGGLRSSEPFFDFPFDNRGLGDADFPALSESPSKSGTWEDPYNFSKRPLDGDNSFTGKDNGRPDTPTPQDSDGSQRSQSARVARPYPASPKELIDDSQPRLSRSCPDGRLSNQLFQQINVQAPKPGERDGKNRFHDRRQYNLWMRAREYDKFPKCVSVWQ